MSQSDRFLITQSLLSSWEYMYKADDGWAEQSRNDFMRALNRISTPPNDAMQNGIDFEDMVTAHCEGQEQDVNHKWYDCASHIGEILKGGQLQVAEKKEIRIKDIDFLLYGRLDALKGGVVYDIKFSRTYSPGKYLDSPQHPMYMELVPEAKKFVYLISDGSDVFTESYDREDTPCISDTVGHFIDYLNMAGLMDTYKEKWRSK